MVVGAILPAIWLSVSYTVYGGRIEENLPPGYSVQVLLFALLTGSVFTAISATYGYVEHLNS